MIFLFLLAEDDIMLRPLTNVVHGAHPPAISHVEHLVKLKLHVPSHPVCDCNNLCSCLSHLYLQRF